jgi:hypothetical protein
VLLLRSWGERFPLARVSVAGADLDCFCSLSFPAS